MQNLYWTLVEDKTGLRIVDVWSDQVDLVKREDGVLFENHSDAQEAVSRWVFEDGSVLGSLSREVVDGSRIYIPVRVVVG